MVGILAEPVIYLAVWTAIADQQGGQVGGFTAGDFAAYYIVWTLVRNFNVVNVGAWEYRVRTGELSQMLLRPIHPFSWDLGYQAGWKFILVALWIPVAIFLSAMFRPTFDIRVVDVFVFLLALWGTYVVRSFIYVIVGGLAFWTTRIWPIVELVMTLELLFSGRLVPLSLMPDWAQALANFMPFKWTFGFPIEALVGRLSDADLLAGLLAQGVWIVIGVVVLKLFWPRAVRHYSAVSG
jgi:ABC-2 type transport system permease protein